MSPLRRALLVLLGVAFVSVGVLHFLAEETFVAMIPPGFPSPRALVVISGVAEIALGIGALIPRTRAYAGWGLVALLIAVFPANIHMALTETPAIDAPRWALYARLPLQFLLAAWAVWATGATSLMRARRAPAT